MRKVSQQASCENTRKRVKFEVMDSDGGSKQRRTDWDAAGVLALRHHLSMSQDAFADELGTRQQTVSEWETGRYRPRGTSVRLLSIIAERAGFEYDAGGGDSS